MTETSIGSSRVPFRRVLVVTFTAPLLFFVWTRVTADASELEVAGKVFDAWSQRPKKIRSFQYQCDLVRTKVAGDGKGIEEPFADRGQDGASNKLEILQGRFTFTMAGEKLAYRETGDGWDEQFARKRPRNVTAIFDGDSNKSLHAAGPIPLGGITKATLPADSLTVSTNIIAILWTHSPVRQLERQAYHVQQMTVRESHIQCDGIDCMQLSIPRGKPGSKNKWTGFVYVDPAREYLPIRFVQELNGQRRSAYSIKYVPDSQIGWRISEWTEDRFDETGRLDYTLSGRVTACMINKPVSDDTFAIEFPIGTHVVERDGVAEKYFIVEGGEQRKYIPQSEYGALERK